MTVTAGDLRSDAGTEPKKVAKTWPNVANGVDSWLREKWPELVGVRGLWFTGSSVWSHLYAMYPPAKSDLDIFCLPLSAARYNEVSDGVLGALGLNILDSKRTYLGARRWQSKRGQIDFWMSDFPTVHQQLLAYSSDSHAQCRAAYSFTDGLVVLPNEKAV